ncbi:helix-turn-helix domain-containing protein [Dysgonomonas macrotermitis]|uniref:Helix-turn-helix n=1 Tax=Dysgonomonas macrotermitis TaxID=1346286 RepID=A0A1M4X2X9_9BACT|nr:helix-turn-helix transcriptional regulator [Dysgonomonas macrotermitis]SHE87821.1 Helix-turn-helix [Dysgonomonas macrotermitis]
MEATANKKIIHHGRNIRLGRNWKGVSQETLAFNLGMSQKQISEIESKETVDDIILEQIAASLVIPVDFLKSYNMDEAINMHNLTLHDNEITNTSAEGSKDVVTQQNVEEQNNYNYPIDDIKDLYNKLIDEKDKQIQRFEKQVDDLLKQVEELRGNIKK